MLFGLLDLLNLPGHALLPLLDQQTEEHLTARPPPGIPDPLLQPQPAQLAAKKRAYQDLWSKAMQALMSNGTAPDDEATFQQMKAMHPQRSTPLRRHQPTGEQVSLSVAHAKRLLYRAASSDRTCVDVFGWATDFLFHVRATPFLRQLTRLVA